MDGGLTKHSRRKQMVCPVSLYWPFLGAASSGGGYVRKVAAL